MYNIYSPGSKEFTNSISIKTITVFCQGSKLQPTQNICHLLMNMPHVGLLHIPSQRAMPRCTSRCRLSQWGRCLHFFCTTWWNMGHKHSSLHVPCCQSFKKSRWESTSTVIVARNHMLLERWLGACYAIGPAKWPEVLIRSSQEQGSGMLVKVTKEARLQKEMPRITGQWVRECHSPVPKLEPKKTFEKNTP